MSTDCVNQERAILDGANLRKAGSEHLGQLCLDFRADQSNPVEVLDVHAIFKAVAGKLHAHQVRYVSQKDTFTGCGGGRGRDGLDIFRAHFLVQKYEMDGTPELSASTSMSISAT
ncbi:MAG: hypothetical protein WKF37_15760 [Bryobacteraceae bacterium]